MNLTEAQLLYDRKLNEYPPNQIATSFIFVYNNLKAIVLTDNKSPSKNNTTSLLTSILANLPAFTKTPTSSAFIQRIDYMNNRNKKQRWSLRLPFWEAGEVVQTTTTLPWTSIQCLWTLLCVHLPACRITRLPDLYFKRQVLLNR